MLHRTFNLTTRDGLELYAQRWEPDQPHAVLCLLHGLGEHSDRYAHLAERFSAAGLALVTCDLRGHGRSAGRRGHIPSYNHLMDDIALLLKTAQERYPELPVLLYGHSLGGNLAIHYTLRKQPAPAGIIATAPLLRLAEPPPGWKTMLLHTLRALKLNIALSSGLDDMALSRDINVVRTYRNDPLTHNRITPTLAVEMLRAGKWNLQHAATLPCPLLLLHGTADRITSAEASRTFAARAPDCTLNLWPGFFHELHNDPGQNDVLTCILNWIRKTCAL